MKLSEWVIWILIGGLTAFIFLKMQGWTVRLITPEKPKLSTGLVIGGAVLRWVLIFLLLAFALHQSILASLALFGTFMIIRLVLLFFFEPQITSGSFQPKRIKD